MKKLMMIVIFSSILSTQTMFTMHNEELGPDHDQKMKANIDAILGIYSDSMQTFGNAHLNDAPKINEYLRLARIARNLMQKYLPESTSTEIAEKNIRITGTDFVINWFTEDITSSSKK